VEYNEVLQFRWDVDGPTPREMELKWLAEAGIFDDGDPILIPLVSPQLWLG
jgi:hypothetical protein